ncbi:S49 family peptidase [Flavobacterium hauense]
MWGITFEALSTWAPIAQKIMSGAVLELDLKPGALLTVFDKNKRIVSPDENGHLEVPPGSVAVVDMVGILIKYGDWCTNGATEIVAVLDEIEANPNYIGYVLYGDGPGGAVNAISPFVSFGLRRKKPSVGLYEQLCSAHLYAMLQCVDHLMAENDLSATIGSVGVVLSFKDNRKFLESLGYVIHEIYPDESEDKNLALRLALEGKYDMIKKEMLSPLAIKFQNAVVDTRPKLKKNAPGVLTGKTFYTDQAIEYGLVDSKGSLSDAIDMVHIRHEMKSLFK